MTATAFLAAVVARAGSWFEPVTLERIIALPAGEQRPWLEYLARAQRLFAEERDLRAAEARRAGHGSPSPRHEKRPAALVDGGRC